jgi:hypothetical protein
VKHAVIVLLYQTRMKRICSTWKVENSFKLIETEELSAQIPARRKSMSGEHFRRIFQSRALILKLQGTRLRILWSRP